MTRRRASTAVSAAILLTAAGTIALAQDQAAEGDAAGSGSYLAFIRDGDCLDPGNEVGLLVDLASATSVADDAANANDPAEPILGSITEVQLSLESLAGNVISVEEPEPRTIVACGTIGATLIDDAGVAVALYGPDGDDLTGMAWLEGLGLEATNVRVFLVDAGAVAAAVESDDSPAPEGDPAAGGSPTPDGSPMPDLSPVPDMSPGPDISPLPDVSPMPDASRAPDPSPAPPDRSPLPSTDPDGDIDPDPDDPGGPDPDVDIDPSDDIDVDVGSEDS